MSECSISQLGLSVECWWNCIFMQSSANLVSRHVIPGEVRVDIVTIRQFEVYCKHGCLPAVCSRSYPEQQTARVSDSAQRVRGQACHFLIFILKTLNILLLLVVATFLPSQSGGTFKKRTWSLVQATQTNDICLKTVSGEDLLWLEGVTFVPRWKERLSYLKIWPSFSAKQNPDNPGVQTRKLSWGCNMPLCTSIREVTHPKPHEDPWTV